MSRFDMGKICSATALVAALSAGPRATAQDSGRIFPWPTIEKRPAAKKDPNIRRATLVEVLDHKKRLIEQASAEVPTTSEAVLVDEPFAPVRTEPALPGVPMVDPTLPPPAPPSVPARATPIPIAPPRAATPQAPQKSATTPPPASKSMAVPYASPPGTVPVPVIIEGPMAPPPESVMLPPDGLLEGPHVDGAIAEGEGVMPEHAESYLPSVGHLLPGIYGEFGVVWLRLSTRQDDTLVHTRFNGTQIVDRDSRDFDGNGIGGARVTFGMPVSCGVYLESSFMGFVGWERERSLSGVQITRSRSAFPLIAGATFTDQQARLETDFSSSEINFKYAFSVYPMSCFIFGIRNFNLTQDFEVVELGTVPVQGGTAPITAAMDVHVTNRIWGPQIGIESRWVGWTNRWSFDSFIKGGFGWNSDRVRIERSISNSVAGAQASVVSDREGDTIGFFEINSGFTYRFTPCIAFRTGYHVLGLFGYASAPLQRPNAFFDEETRFKVDSSERAYIYGPYASLEFVWGGVR